MACVGESGYATKSHDGIVVLISCSNCGGKNIFFAPLIMMGKLTLAIHKQLKYSSNLIPIGSWGVHVKRFKTHGETVGMNHVIFA